MPGPGVLLSLEGPTRACDEITGSLRTHGIFSGVFSWDTHDVVGARAWNGKIGSGMGLDVDLGIGLSIDAEAEHFALGAISVKD